MTPDFPYRLQSKKELNSRMNELGGSHAPFLFILDYKAAFGYVIESKDIDARYIRFQTQSAMAEPISKKIEWDIQSPSFESYSSKFRYVQEQIFKGNSFLTNLTQPSVVRTNFSLFDLYQRGSAKYKLWLNKIFTVLSPETFVRIEGRTISSFPMKGTIDAAIHDAERIILSDPKEMAEHATIVDLIRNDLSLVASEVEVKRYRYVEKITTNKHDLLQVSSEIVGLLPPNFHNVLGDIIFKLLPAGSISGAPKKKTLEIIAQAEGYDRGFYTGICGYFDGNNLDSAVMIRFIEQQDNQLVFKSGGGITAQSDLYKEYHELIQKVYVPIS